MISWNGYAFDSCAFMMFAGMLMWASFRVAIPWLSAAAGAAFFVLWLLFLQDLSAVQVFWAGHVYAFLVLVVAHMFPQAEIL